MRRGELLDNKSQLASCYFYFDILFCTSSIGRAKAGLDELEVYLIEYDTKRRISGYGEESEGHECCKRKPKLYCVTCCGNFEFCIKCGNSHSEKIPKHDVIACSNRQIRCRKHDTFPIRWFCCFCQDYICDSCITLNRDAGGHAGHALQNLCDRILDLSSSLKSLLGELTFTFEKLKIEMKGLDELKETMMESVSIDEDMRKKKIKDIENDREKKLLELNSNRKRIRDITGGDIKILEIYVRKYIGQVNP
ncbi:hypothetical protein FSP39_024739 [Pinctada imbricata]|uniref:B box-type domain-containing protein n=1 Tax=Pinctada imbricata TaxID=66713 RepID=A0AA88YJD2_PINIB|nr:hypothetical protein FSP39_024739 [Pinctada imbricata]